MKERILFECVGQAGGNIGQLLMEKGYICHFINSSIDDLDSVKVNNGFKFHIPNAMGCSKDRKKAMKFAKEYYKLIIETIDKRFAMQDIVYFVFSLGGGTGSGISPMLLDYLSNNNLHKHYGAICILPSINEPIRAQVNAIEAYNQLKKIENLKNIFVIDNNCGMNRFAINREFVELFDELINITHSDNRGIIDQDELTTILTTKGMMAMGYFDNVEYALINDCIFAPFKKNCDRVAISICDDVDIEIIEKTMNYPTDIYTGYNEEKNFIVLCGMPMSTSRIESLATRVESKQFDRTDEGLDKNIKTPTIKESSIITSKAKVSFDDVFGKFINS